MKAFANAVADPNFPGTERELSPYPVAPPSPYPSHVLRSIHVAIAAAGCSHEYDFPNGEIKIRLPRLAMLAIKRLKDQFYIRTDSYELLESNPFGLEELEIDSKWLHYGTHELFTLVRPRLDQIDR